MLVAVFVTLKWCKVTHSKNKHFFSFLFFNNKLGVNNKDNEKTLGVFNWEL